MCGKSYLTFILLFVVINIPSEHLKSAGVGVYFAMNHFYCITVLFVIIVYNVGSGIASCNVSYFNVSWIVSHQIHFVYRSVKH